MAIGDTVLANRVLLQFGAGFTAPAGSPLVNTYEVLDFDWSGIEKASVDTAAFGTTGGKTFIYSDQYDPGTLDVTIHFDDTGGDFVNTDLANAMTTPGALTLTFPATGAGAAGKWACTNAALVSMGVSGSLDDKITQPLSFKLSGTITMTDAA